MRFRELVTIVVGITLLTVCFRHCAKCEPNKTLRDTITDTIRVAQPVAVDSVVVRHKIVPIHRYTDSVRLVVRDSIVIRDSVAVVPITQKMYRDSTYTAWVSGFHPSLDSIHVQARTITVQAQPLKVQVKRWGVGIQGGYGFTPKGLQPYIGVGINYNIRL